MIPKPNLSPHFSVEDIRKLRTYTAELMENMTKEERRMYIKNGAEKAYLEIERIKAENVKKATGTNG